MSHLTEALEVASDVAVEFQSFMLGLELVPMHIEMLEKGVSTVLSPPLQYSLHPCSTLSPPAVRGSLCLPSLAGSTGGQHTQTVE